MKDLSRRDAMLRIAGGGAGLALSLNGTALANGEGLEAEKEQASITQAMRLLLTVGRKSPSDETPDGER